MDFNSVPHTAPSSVALPELALYQTTWAIRVWRLSSITLEAPWASRSEKSGRSAYISCPFEFGFENVQKLVPKVATFNIFCPKTTLVLVQNGSFGVTDRILFSFAAVFRVAIQESLVALLETSWWILKYIYTPILRCECRRQWHLWP